MGAENLLRGAVGAAQAVRSRLENRLAVGNGSGGVLNGSDEVSRTEFKTFMETIHLDRSKVQALEWVPKVLAGGRNYYEE